DVRQAGQHLVALVTEARLDGRRLREDAVRVEEARGRPLQRARPATVEERAGARQRLDDGLRPERPGDAPPRVAPVLRQAVEEEDGIDVDVLDITRSGLDVRPPAVR